MPKDKKEFFKISGEPPIENQVILSLVDDFIREDLQDFDMERLTLIDIKEFGVVAPEQDFLKVQSEVKEQVIQKTKAIFNDSNTYEQQHKNYRSLFVDSVEQAVLAEIYGELERYERRKLYENCLDEKDRENFKSFEVNAYLEIIKSKLIYHLVMSILQEIFDDARESSFPGKLTYQLNKYGAVLFEFTFLELEGGNSEELEVLKNEMDYYEEGIAVEKKFLISLYDLKFRDLFSRGYGSVLISAN